MGDQIKVMHYLTNCYKKLTRNKNAKIDNFFAKNYLIIE